MVKETERAFKVETETLFCGRKPVGRLLFFYCGLFYCNTELCFLGSSDFGFLLFLFQAVQEFVSLQSFYYSMIIISSLIISQSCCLLPDSQPH